MERLSNIPKMAQLGSYGAEMGTQIFILVHNAWLPNSGFQRQNAGVRAALRCELSQ